MNIHIDNEDSLTMAKISGEIGVDGARQLTDELRDLACGDGATLAVDLSELQAIDSSGLSALIDLVARSRLSGGRVILASPSSFVRGVLEVTRLDGWFDICDNLAQARQRLVSE